jgi:hypothetical protein
MMYKLTNYKYLLLGASITLFFILVYLEWQSKTYPSEKQTASNLISAMPYLFLYFVATFSTLALFLYRLIKPTIDISWIYLSAFLGILFSYLLNYEMSKFSMVDHSKFGLVAGWIIAIPNLIIVLLAYFNKREEPAKN